MFTLIFIIWLILLLYFDPFLLKYISFQNNIIAAAGIIVFVLLLNFFWLISLYHIIVSIFSKFISPPQYEKKLYSSFTPTAAILYTTMNDFNEEAVLSCVYQNYSNFDVFILDDSTDNKIKKQIDSFVLHYSEKVKLIRRSSKIGYKAGNLNYALNSISKKYDFFAVCDADGILPHNFLSKLLLEFLKDESIAIVQANQRAKVENISVFAQDFAFLTDIHWKYYVPVRSKFGFMMFYGHGAVIRTSVWEEVGGFPETITEDIAFSSIVRTKGYKIVFAPNIICLEEFPRNYCRFRKRNERWVRGTIEYLLKWYPSFLLSKKVAMKEKIDIFLASANLLIALPFFLYLIIVGIMLPFSLPYFKLHIPLMMKAFPDIKFYFTSEFK